METWVALLRGVNVGGRNRISMTALATAFDSAGCCSVRTYIQSGNVVFATSTKSKRALNKELGDAIEATVGFRPNLMLLTAADFRAAVTNNPFPEAIVEPKSLHFYFLDTKPESPDLAGIAELAAPTERFQWIGAVFYVHAPEGIGRSKLAAGVERKLGIPATARNYNTIQNLSEMLADDGPVPFP